MLSKLASVENKTFFAEVKRLWTTMSLIFLVAGVEEATNSATFILAKECFARFPTVFDFEQETFLNTRILTNFKTQLNRSMLRNEVCSVIVISKITCSKIAKLFDILVNLVLETETLCALKAHVAAWQSIVIREHSKSKLTMFRRKSSSSCLYL